MIVIVCGLPGSGKSYFASRLAEKLSAQHISSDLTRKDMDAMGRYTFNDKLVVYQVMCDLARHGLKRGQAVVLDATFHHHTMRDMFTGLADELQIPLRFIKVEASPQLIKKRLSLPRQDSEADYQVYLNIQAQFEELTTRHLLLHSDEDNINDMLTTATTYLKESP